MTIYIHTIVLIVVLCVIYISSTSTHIYVYIQRDHYIKLISIQLQLIIYPCYFSRLSELGYTVVASRAMHAMLFWKTAWH